MLHAGVGTTLAAAALTGMFLGLAYREVPVARATARVRVTPSPGRTHAGVHVLVRF